MSKLNLTIYTSEKDLKLALSKDGDGVALVVVDEDGEPYNWLVTLKNDGQVYLHGGIDEELGLPLDGEGSLFLAEEL